LGTGTGSPRFGGEHVEAMLSASGRRLLVVGPCEVDDDPGRDVTQILTSLRPGQPGPVIEELGDSPSGKRKGAPVGFPRFKSRRSSRLSVRFTTGAIRCETRHAVLPRLGRIKLHENGADLVAKVEAGTARVISAAAGFERGRWFVSFTVDAQRPVLTPAQPGAVVGVDLGIKTLAVLSSGEQIPNPRHSNAGQRKIRRLSHAVSRRVGP